MLILGCITGCVADSDWQPTGNPCVRTLKQCIPCESGSCPMTPTPPAVSVDTPVCCAAPSPTPCADCTGTQPSAIGTGLSSGTWPYAGFNPGPCIWSWFRIDIGGSITVIFTGGSFYVSAPGIDGGVAQPLACIGGTLTGVATTGGNTVTFG
jgi:hypothetical protein